MKTTVTEKTSEKKLAVVAAVICVLFASSVFLTSRRVHAIRDLEVNPYVGCSGPENFAPKKISLGDANINLVNAYRTEYKKVDQNYFFFNVAKTMHGCSNSKLITQLESIWYFIYLRLFDNFDDLLELHLNINDYGTFHNKRIVGAEEASERYFNISQSKLNVSQAALLFVLRGVRTTDNTNILSSPFVGMRNLILKSMAENNFISREEMEKAIVEK